MTRDAEPAADVNSHREWGSRRGKIRTSHHLAGDAAPGAQLARTLGPDPVLLTEVVSGPTATAIGRAPGARRRLSTA